MIKIEAKRNGDGVDIQMNIEGKGEAIYYEAVAVLVNFQKALMKSDPKLFALVLGESAKKMMDYITEEAENAGTDTRELS